jgi:hypothetical protein
MGRASECKGCSNKRNNASYRNSPRARAKVLVSHARTRAEKKGLAFELDIEWAFKAIAAGSCEVTGLPFDLSLTGARNLYGPSLDRVDPTMGYTRENTRVVLFGYNACKNTASETEVIDFFRTVAGTFI